MEALFPLFVIVLIAVALFQLGQAYIIKSNSWKMKGYVSDREAVEYSRSIEKLMFVPNHPTFWNSLKDSYYRILHSDDVSYETKLSLYHILNKFKVRGLNPPRKPKKQEIYEHNPATWKHDYEQKKPATSSKVNREYKSYPSKPELDVARQAQKQERPMAQRTSR